MDQKNKQKEEEEKKELRKEILSGNISSNESKINMDKKEEYIVPKELINIHQKNKQKEENQKELSKNNELKIEIFPENKPRYKFKKEPVKQLITEDTIGYSFDKNRNLVFINRNVPLLKGFFQAHINHYPIRIRPDDIWLLIVQGFSNHVNANSKELRNYFVNFDGKKTLKVKYNIDPKNVNKKILENFSIQINKQMEKYLGKEIMENLTPNFTTTDYDSIIISKLSIMGAFKKYFEYKMSCITCGNPYIILEGTSEGCKKIINKAKNLRKYKFEWYIDRVIPLIQKMVDAKEGNVDIEHFKNIIHQRTISAPYSPSIYLSGWILKFFAYQKEGKEIIPFNAQEIGIKFLDKLANQMLIVPFTIIDGKTGNQYLMKYKVGFIGCDINEKNEVYPIQGWIVSKSTEEERNSIL